MDSKEINFNELITVENSQPVTTSKNIAEVFGKVHKNVLRDIKEIVNKFDSLNLENKMFYKAIYKNRGKQYPMYIMNKNGFALLAMGYTGKRALTFKLEYIKAFDEMETQLQTSYFIKILNKVKQVENNDINYHAYLINERNTNNYKIGVSSDVQQRLSQLQIGNANQLVVTAISDSINKTTAYHLETKLHNLLSNKQLTNEWFKLSADDIRLIKFSFDIINN